MEYYSYHIFWSDNLCVLCGNSPSILIGIPPSLCISFGNLSVFSLFAWAWQQFYNFNFVCVSVFFFSFLFFFYSFSFLLYRWYSPFAAFINATADISVNDRGNGVRYHRKFDRKIFIQHGSTTTKKKATFKTLKPKQWTARASDDRVSQYICRWTDTCVRPDGLRLCDDKTMMTHSHNHTYAHSHISDCQFDAS